MSEDQKMTLRSVRQRSEAGYYGLDWHPAEDDVEFLLSLIDRVEKLHQDWRNLPVYITIEGATLDGVDRNELLDELARAIDRTDKIRPFRKRS